MLSSHDPLSLLSDTPFAFAPLRYSSWTRTKQHFERPRRHAGVTTKLRGKAHGHRDGKKEPAPAEGEDSAEAEAPQGAEGALDRNIDRGRKTLSRRKCGDASLLRQKN